MKLRIYLFVALAVLIFAFSADAKKQALRHGSDANPFFYEDIAVDYNPQ